MEDPKSSLKYIEVADFLRKEIPAGSIVYVRGKDKANWLRQIVPEADVYNVEDEGCPSIKDMKGSVSKWPRCTCHQHPKNVCALENAYLLREWMSLNQDAVDK